MTRAFTRLSRFGACAVGCFAFDLDGALDVALLPLTTHRTAPLLLLSFGVALAVVCRAAFGARGERASHVRRRAYVIAALATAPLALAAHASVVVALGLVVAACTLMELAGAMRPSRAFVLASFLPLVITGSVFVAGLVRVPTARAAIVRRLKVSGINRGTTRFVPGWGFVDVSHIHPGIYRAAFAQLEAGAREVRAQTEIIALTGDVYVIERMYRVRSERPPRWALACAIALDIGAEAERTQAALPWWMGFAPSAYQFDDMPSNLFGCLGSTGEIAERSRAVDTTSALARFRAEAHVLSRRRRTRYELPPGATSEERAALRVIEAAGRALAPRPLRVGRQPVSR